MSAQPLPIYLSSADRRMLVCAAGVAQKTFSALMVELLRNHFKTAFANLPLDTVELTLAATRYPGRVTRSDGRKMRAFRTADSPFEADPKAAFRGARR